MMKGKCGGGKKLDISLNFPTERAFIEHVRDIFAACWHCETIHRKKNMVLMDPLNTAGSYLCQNCKNE